MSETVDDRAAKAARGKAMLKKRQQKTSVAGSRATSLASPPPSRSFTPTLPAEPAPVAESHRDINDLFGPSDAETGNWIHSLPRADINGGAVDPKPSPRSPPPPQERTDVPAPPLQTGIQASSRRDMETSLHEERAQHDVLQDGLRRAAESDAALTRRLEELSREKSRLEDLHGVAQAKITNLEAGRAELEQRLGEAGTKVESLQSDVDRLASDLESTQREVRTARDHSTKLEHELSAAHGQIEALGASAVAASKRWQEQDQTRQQTISLLVSEKASMIASVQRLEEIETELQEKESSFLSEQAKATDLSKRVQEFEITSAKQRSELGEVVSRERELVERVRDQEREIQLRKAELDEVQATSTQHQQRVRELEEQIESDDRADRLEVSLKNTQDRSEELEFQLNKVQQSYTTIKSERDKLESLLHSATQSEADWKFRHSGLVAEHSILQGHLQSANDRRDALLEERASLQSQVEFNQSAVKQLQQKLGELASEVTSSDRTLQNVQGELRAALRRADESEKTQKDLQAEGTRLVQSLEEMQPKIVELTSVKLELMEQIERLEHEKRTRDTLISKLEMALNEGTEREAEAAKLRKESDALRERDSHSLEQSVAELQRGYALLEAELQSAQATVKTMETERTRMRQTELRQADLGNRMSAEARRREEEISQLEAALAASRKNEAEQSHLIQHYRTEMEALQTELVAKEEELATTTGTSESRNDMRSLDDEMLGAVKQQHAIELSSAHSQIRALESAVFEAQDKAHRLQRHIHILEDQLATRSVSRSAAAPSFPSSSRPFSPAQHHRPSSRASNKSIDLRRGSLTSSSRSSHLVPPTRSVFDVGLSPEARHKRQVSLSMLKARIESETAAHRQTPPPRGGGLSPVPDSLSDSETHSHRPQFMDESHIFWCHSCRGELVIL